jgi:hypothetical protein
MVTWCDRKYLFFRFGRFVLSGILENCDASVKAEVGPIFRVFLTSVAETYYLLRVRFRLLTRHGSGSETLFLSLLTLFTEEERWKVGVIYPRKRDPDLHQNKKPYPYHSQKVDPLQCQNSD